MPFSYFYYTFQYTSNVKPPLTVASIQWLSGNFHLNHMSIPLTNQVRGPYRKLQTKFFPLQFMAQARSAQAINHRETRGSVTYRAD